MIVSEAVKLVCKAVNIKIQGHQSGRKDGFMRKKLLSILLAGIMTLSVCACGNDAENANGTSESKESQGVQNTTETSKGSEAIQEPEEYVPTYPIVDEPITVKGVVVGKTTEVRSDRIIWNKVSEVTGINIEWEVIDTEAFPTYLASGEWPDFIHHTLSASQINDYGVAGGKFVNFYDYLDIMPNLVKTFEDYPYVKKAATHSNGEMYCLPGVEMSATKAACRPYVRTDVLEAAGLKMPTTIDEFYNCLVALKEKNGEAGFIYRSSSDENDWGPFLYAAFGTSTNMNFDDDGTGKVIFNRTSEQMKLYLEFMHKIYSEGLLHQEYLTMETAVRDELVKKGKWAFTDNGVQRMAASDFPDGEFHIDCLAPLTSEYDSTQEILGISGYKQGCLFINKESEYIEELCKMFDIIYATEEVVEGSGLAGYSFHYGLKGIDWDYGPEGSGTYEVYLPEGYTKVAAVYETEELLWMACGRLDALAGKVISDVSNSQVRQIAFSKNIIPYQSDLYFPVKLLSFTDDEQYILDNKLSDIQKYYKEMEGKFITGITDIETGWDEYCATLEKMGIQDVIEVYQAAYDRFNSAE